MKTAGTSFFGILLGVSACSRPALELGHEVKNVSVADAGTVDTAPDAGPGTDSNAPPAPAVPVCPIPPDVEAFVSELVKRHCVASINCCSTFGFGSDPLESCIADTPPWFRYYLEQSCVSLRPQQAARCLAELDKMATVCPRSVDRFHIYDATCRAAITGTVPEGEPCRQSFDCQAPANGSAVCLTGIDVEDGTSQCKFERYLQQEGEACDVRNGRHCDRSAGLYCGISGACRRIGQLGEPCEPTGFRDVPSCVKGGYCANHLCRPTLPEGAACTTDIECGDDNSCNSGVCRSMFGLPCSQEMPCDLGDCLLDDRVPSGGPICAPNNAAITISRCRLP